MPDQWPMDVSVGQDGSATGILPLGGSDFSLNPPEIARPAGGEIEYDAQLLTRVWLASISKPTL